MKSRIVIVVLAVAVAAGLAATAVSQEPESRLLLVSELHINPGHTADFEAANRARAERMREAGVSFLTRASVSESLVYRFSTPVGDWAGIARRGSEMRQMAPADPSMRPAAAAIASIDSSIWRTRPELNYTPENPRLEGADWGFVRRISFHVKQGMMDELADVIRDAGALYERHGSGESFFVTSQVTGADGPKMSVAVLAADAADYYMQAAKAEEQMGEALQDIRARAGALCRRIELSNYTIRRDLGYRPPE